MQEQTRRQGKTNRKHGRSKNKPTHKRYTAEKRWIKNKALAIYRQIKKHSNYKPCNISDDVKFALAKLQREG